VHFQQIRSLLTHIKAQEYHVLAIPENEGEVSSTPGEELMQAERSRRYTSSPFGAQPGEIYSPRFSGHRRCHLHYGRGVLRLALVAISSAGGFTRPSLWRPTRTSSIELEPNFRLESHPVSSSASTGAGAGAASPFAGAFGRRIRAAGAQSPEGQKAHDKGAIFELVRKSAILGPVVVYVRPREGWLGARWCPWMPQIGSRLSGRRVREKRGSIRVQQRAK
jgi:hypothetical protein